MRRLCTEGGCACLPVKKIMHERYVEMDPHDILQLPRGFSLEQLRSNYKRIALQLHPDKIGGRMTQAQANDIFQILTTAYKTLLKDHEVRMADKPFHVMREASTQHQHQHRPQQPPPPSTVMGSDFSISKFNAVFDQNRLPDAHDNGYAEWIRKNDPDREAKQPKRHDIIKYTEPVPAANLLQRAGACVTYCELGVDKVRDFSRVDNNGVAYTDYRLAHTRTKLMYENEIDDALKSRPDFKSMDELKSHRANQSFDMTDADHARIHRMRAKEAAREEQRARVQASIDATIARSYDNAHVALLGYHGAK